MFVSCKNDIQEIEQFISQQVFRLHKISFSKGNYQQSLRYLLHDLELAVQLIKNKNMNLQFDNISCIFPHKNKDKVLLNTNPNFIFMYQYQIKYDKNVFSILKLQNNKYIIDLDTLKSQNLHKFIAENNELKSFLFSDKSNPFKAILTEKKGEQIFKKKHNTLPPKKYINKNMVINMIFKSAKNDMWIDNKSLLNVYKIYKNLKKISNQSAYDFIMMYY